MLSLSASRLYDSWLGNPEASLEVEPSTALLLGAFEPLLEGLAIYGQLDYESAGSEADLWSPINQVVEVTDLRFRNLEKSLVTLQRLIREDTVYERRDDAASFDPDDYDVETPSLLDLLFNSADHQTQHYFVGYLYVKALIEQVAHLLRDAGDRATAMSVVLKLLCDHPTLTEVAGESVGVAEVLERIHSDIARISPDAWRGIRELVSQPDASTYFRAWDVYGQLRENTFDEWTLFEETRLIEELGISDDEAAGRLSDVRSASAILLVWWRKGKLVATRDGLALDTGQERVRIVLPKVSGFILNAAREDEKLVPGAIFTAVAEDEFRDRVAGTVGASPTLAMFTTLTTSTCGLALWGGADAVVWYPFLGDMLLDKDLRPTKELDLIQRGLKLDPYDREGLGHAIVDVDDGIARLRCDATRWLMEQLVSHSDIRADLAGRFGATAFSDAQTDVAAWVRPQPLRSAHTPGRHLVLAGSEVFDFPGFRNFGRQLVFSDLLPVLDPPRGD